MGTVDPEMVCLTVNGKPASSELTQMVIAAVNAHRALREGDVLVYQHPCGTRGRLVYKRWDEGRPWGVKTSCDPALILTVNGEAVRFQDSDHVPPPRNKRNYRVVIQHTPPPSKREDEWHVTAGSVHEAQQIAIEKLRQFNPGTQVHGAIARIR